MTNSYIGTALLMAVNLTIVAVTWHVMRTHLAHLRQSARSNAVMRKWLSTAECQ